MARFTRKLSAAAAVALLCAGALACTKYPSREKQEKPLFDTAKATLVDSLNHIYSIGDMKFFYDADHDAALRIPNDFTYNVNDNGASFYGPDSLMVITLAYNRIPLDPSKNNRDLVQQLFSAVESDSPIVLRELNDSIISGDGVVAGSPFFLKWGYEADSLGLNVRQLRFDYEPFDHVEQAAEAIFPTTVSPFPFRVDTTVAEEEYDWI